MPLILGKMQNGITENPVEKSVGMRDGFHPPYLKVGGWKPVP